MDNVKESPKTLSDQSTQVSPLEISVNEQSKLLEEFRMTLQNLIIRLNPINSINSLEKTEIDENIQPSQPRPPTSPMKMNIEDNNLSIRILNNKINKLMDTIEL